MELAELTVRGFTEEIASASPAPGGGSAAALAGEVKSLARELEQVKAAAAASQIEGLFESAADVNGIKILTAYFSGTAPEALRSMSEKVRDKAPNVVSALVGSSEGKLTLAVACGKGALDAGLKAGVLAKQIAAIAGGNGGGKPDLAMAGLKDETKIDEALNAVPGIVKAALEGRAGSSSTAAPGEQGPGAAKKGAGKHGRLPFL